MNTRVGILTLLLARGRPVFAGGGTLLRGWLGSRLAKQRLERGGRSAAAHPHLAEPGASGKGLSRTELS